MNIKENFPLKEFNTFGLDVKAEQFAEFNSLNDLNELLISKKFNKSNILVLGGGSNILFTKDFEGTVLKNRILGKEIVHQDDQHVWVKIGAGENWHEFVLYAIANNWGGIENLSLIPGTLGAAPMQNIGAYGTEIRNVFEYLEAIKIKDASLHKFDNEACKFGYRESVFKNVYKDQYIITHVVLKLTKHHHSIDISYGAIKDTLEASKVENPTIRDVSNAVIRIRQSKLPDPSQIGNAGSFFKNPSVDKIDFEGLRAEFPHIPGYEQPGDMVKVPAGWLIEKCGWKGFRKDDIGVHKNQALVLVNYGSGQGNQLKKLAEEVKSSVADKFGVELTAEVNII